MKPQRTFHIVHEKMWAVVEDVGGGKHRILEVFHTRRSARDVQSLPCLVDDDVGKIKVVRVLVSSIETIASIGEER